VLTVKNEVGRQGEGVHVALGRELLRSGQAVRIVRREQASLPLILLRLLIEALLISCTTEVPQ
jgi:hypothetical protein